MVHYFQRSFEIAFCVFEDRMLGCAIFKESYLTGGVAGSNHRFEPICQKQLAKLPVRTPGSPSPVFGLLAIHTAIRNLENLRFLCTGSATGSNHRFETATPEKFPSLPVRTRGSNRCHRFAGSV